MSVWTYLSPLLRLEGGRASGGQLPPYQPADGETVRVVVAPVGDITAAARATHVWLLEYDPTYCCAKCEALTTLLVAHRQGRIGVRDLAAAVAAHDCERSPLTTIRAARAAVDAA